MYEKLLNAAYVADVRRTHRVHEREIVIPLGGWEAATLTKTQ